MNQTPSPSDSAVGDLETMLKEKDTEINYLRETMEQNEQVIFKVSLVAGLLLSSKIYHSGLSKPDATHDKNLLKIAAMNMMPPRLISN